MRGLRAFVVGDPAYTHRDGRPEEGNIVTEAAKAGMTTKTISRSTVRKATLNVVRAAKASDAPLRLTPGQRKHITRSA
jgi:hypothetical protein